MARNIGRWLRQQLQTFEESPSEIDRDHGLQLACAVLLVETARADFEDHPDEREALLAALAREFSLSEEETQALVELAEEKVEDTVSLHAVVRLLNDQLTLKQRERLLERMWHVAYADGQIDKYEEHFIRQAADLLYVSHAGFVRAKHRAEASHRSTN